MLKVKPVLVGGCGLMLLLAGCNPAPKYAKPPAQTPATFKEAALAEYKEGAGWKLAQPGDDKLGGKWWTVYGDATLSGLEEQVAVSNQTILQSEAAFRQARALVVSARASLFPTISVSPGYTNSRFSSTTRNAVILGGSATSGGAGATTGTTGTGTGGTTTTAISTSSNYTNIFTFPVDATYTVDLWHRLRNTVAANAFTAQASAADVATALLSTQAELAQDYFEIRSLDAERKLYQDTVANYQANLKLVQSLFNAGIDSEEDVAQARTQLDTATAQMTDLGVSRSTYEHAIAVLIGKAPATFSLAVAPFTPKPPEIPVALPSELLERRPDIAAAERRVAAANAEIGVARTAYYPNLTLSANGGFETSHFLEWFNWPSRFWSLGPTLQAVVLDVGARRAVTEQAEASYDAEVAAYRGAVLSAFQAVEDNLSTLTILAQEVEQEHTAVNSANHYLDLSLTRFKAGVDSYLNVITAQNALLTNRQTELQIELRRMNASVALVMALGGGWDPGQLPAYKQLLAKPTSKWQLAAPVASGTVAAPNPPVLPSDLPVPGAPDARPDVPRPAPAVGDASK